jgi:lysophospholipase L1-like esterase
MVETPHAEGGARFAAVAFIGGFLTASLIAVVFVVFLGFRVGFMTIWQKTGVALISMTLDMPNELIDELAAMDGVIDNAGNPTGARKHDTIIVRPDEEFEKVLRPGVSVDGFQVRAGDPVNLDPPVVYTRGGAAMSEALLSYLEANTRVRYSYHVDANGFRRTLPQVNAEKKILMVGDSATFGVGVDDEDTIASGLQQLIGLSHRVVNAGVSGYDADQAFRVARKLSVQQEYDVLVYVAHNNDFVGEGKLLSSAKARDVIANFESLKDRFPGGVVVALFVALEYAAEDVLLSEGWPSERVESLTQLRRDLATMTSEAGFAFVDFGDIVADIRAREKTIFAPWPLYVDHSHLSPRGTRIFAEHIYAAIPGRGLDR